MVDGSVRSIGWFDKEEDAAMAYAKAAFKYKQKKGGHIFGGFDLSNIPEQQHLFTSNTKSGYKGVKKCRERWQARICIDKIHRNLGTFDTPEEAAQIYARAVYYLKQNEQGKTGKSNAGEGDLPVPKIPPLPSTKTDDDWDFDTTFSV